MAYQQDLRTEIYTGSWQDISAYVYQRDTVHIQRGRQNEASTMQAGTASLTLNNRDGRFTTRNPAGAYYPNLVQNSPLRLSVKAADAGLSNYLRLEGDSTSSVTTPDSAGLQIAGVLDVRVDLWPSDYSGNVLAAKWGGTAKSWAFLLNGTANPSFINFRDITTHGTGTLGFYWWDGANQQMLDSGATLPYYGQRICLRVLFTPSTGTAQFYTGATMAGPFTQLGTNRVFGATTLSTGVGQAVQVGGALSLIIPPGGYSHTFGSALGYIYEAQVLAAAVVKADPVFSSQTAGATSFTDAQSNTWTLGGTSEISDRLYRYHGELASVPKAADPSATDVYSQTTSYGVSQRLQNSNTPLQSPMRRAYVRLPSTLNLAAYWPGEDGANAKSSGSAFGGTAMLALSGTPLFGSNSDFACSAPLAGMNGATITGNVNTPAGFTWTDNVIRFLWEVPAGGETNNTVIAAVTCSGGGVGYVTLVYTTGSPPTLTMNGYTAAGGTLLGSATSTSMVVTGGQVRFGLALRKNGSSGTDMSMESLAPSGQAIANGTSHAGISASPPGAVVRVQFGSAGVMGHWSVQGVWDTMYDVMGALCSWNGEPAGARVARLCAEEAIAVRVKGPPGLSMPMGNQPIDTLMNILQQCENTDLGMLYEPRECLGIGYRTRSSMYHQAPVCTADYSAGALFQGFGSQADTLLTVNDVTATAPDGSTARHWLGPNGIDT